MFDVQYDGMSDAEKAAAVRERGTGYAGGMPLGAKIGAEAAFKRWWEGERAYVDEVDAFTSADVGQVLVVSGKYAGQACIGGKARSVQWMGGESGRPSVPLIVRTYDYS